MAAYNSSLHSLYNDPLVNTPGEQGECGSISSTVDKLTA